MSDPKSSDGEPVEEPTPADDVVGRAEEASRRPRRRATRCRWAPRTTTRAASPPSRAGDVLGPGAAADAAMPAARGRCTSTSTPQRRAHRRAAVRPAGALRPPVRRARDRRRPRADAAATAAARTAAASLPSSRPRLRLAGPQPIFVQAPEAPLPRGNRAAAGAIGLLAALSFAVLLLLAWIGFGALTGDVTARRPARRDAGRARHLGALGAGRRVLHRVLAARRHHQPRSLGPLGRLRAPGRGRVVRRLPPRPAVPGSVLDAERQPGRRSSSRTSCYAPLAIASFVIGRELTIWFGAWAAARGKRVTELNIEAQREYERTLEAGPKLVRQ